MKLFIGILLVASSILSLIEADLAADSAAAAAAAAAAASDESYSSAVAAAVASSSHHHEIHCKCPFIYSPVCGTDGRTYSNLCILECVDRYNKEHWYDPVKLWKKGHCPRSHCKCSHHGKPVCASNHQTFRSKCELECENDNRQQMRIHHLSLRYEGICKHPRCICPTTSIPVCGKDNRTYRNICLMQCANIGFKSVGACAREACPTCTAVKDEICASDGNTYLNKCLLNCQNRRLSNMGLPQIREEQKGVCPCICPAIYDPVCGSNYKTYSNTCVVACENKIRIHQNLFKLHKKRHLLTILYKGKCVCTNCQKCSNNYAPVCGTDGKTYWNICWLNCNITCRHHLGLHHYGKCRYY